MNSLLNYNSSYEEIAFGFYTSMSYFFKMFLFSSRECLKQL